MKQRIIIKALFIATVVTLLLSVAWFKPYKGLYVHVQDSSWSDVTIDSQNLSQPVTLKSNTGRPTVRVDSISHGVYAIHVKYRDGKEFWAELLHYDAGVRQRLDVYIKRVPGRETIQVTQVANKVIPLFKGVKEAGKTTQKQPFQLDWI